MASGYALPSNGHAKHARYPSLNGLPFDQSSPVIPIDDDHFDSNGLGHKSHVHAHSQRLPMKGRIRGESDLGRPAEHAHDSHPHHHDSKSAFSISEALTAVLIPAQYLFASVAYSSSNDSTSIFPPLAAYSAPLPEPKVHNPFLLQQHDQKLSPFIQACTFTSGTLLLAGVLAKIRSSERAYDRRKRSDANLHAHANGLFSAQAAQKIVVSSLSVGLPFYAAMHLGGMRVGLLILAGTASGLVASTSQATSLRNRIMSNLGLSLVLLSCIFADFLGLTSSGSLFDISLGYTALLLSVFAIPSPLPTISSTGAVKSFSPTAVSPLLSSASDSTNTLAAGVISAVVTVIASMIMSSAPSLAISAITSSTITIATAAGLILFGQPHALQSSYKVGLALGCLVAAATSFLFSPSIWPGSVANGGLAAIAFIGALYDSPASSAEHSHDHNDHVHTGHSHHKHHHHTPSDVSRFTAFLLSRVAQGGLVYDVLCERDSRRIAYFTCLNFAFMLVQAFYGYVSGSLGLLSDTVHMFFDCLALIVGLAASVASKWPTSPEKPYGWGKLNTLAGFGNGIFLMLVSVEFVWEAVEGMMEGTELRHVEELLVVSTLGLIVNMVGLLAFGHAHAGHDHGHSHGGHSHNHGHDHGHGHSHNHSHNHNHTHSHSHNHDHDHGLSHGHNHTHSHNNFDGGHSQSHSHAHEHDHAKPRLHRNDSLYATTETASVPAHAHENENMHGIYLHVAADAGGSLAVIISTTLSLWKPWYVWDPLATIVIALLIFMAAVPLVTQSAKKLLLVIPNDAEWDLKNTLQELSGVRGVTGYANPRFWVDDGGEADDGHGHHHGHDHGHDHGDEKKEKKIMGVIHVYASRAASAEDVRSRVVEFFEDRKMDVVVQVELN